MIKRIKQRVHKFWKGRMEAAGWIVVGNSNSLKLLTDDSGYWWKKGAVVMSVTEDSDGVYTIKFNEGSVDEPKPVKLVIGCDKVEEMLILLLKKRELDGETKFKVIGKL